MKSIKTSSVNSLDNLELLKNALFKDERAVKVLAEMVKKQHNQEFGYLHIPYENGKITCIENSNKIK